LNDREVAMRLGLFAIAAVVSLAGAPALAQPTAPGGFAPQQGMPQQAVTGQVDAQQRATLQRFGQFFPHPRYGEVWRPAQGLVPPDWKPYPPCHWNYDRQRQAWVYEDASEWGRIIHHFGRWALDPQQGWVWIAGNEWGPGWVVWRSDAQRVSWAPMPPDEDVAADPGVMENPALWHVAQAQGFDGRCPTGGPPIASAPPPAPVFVAPRPAAPVFVQRPPPPVIVERPPPIIVERPPPVVVVNPPSFCQRFPTHPRCIRLPFCQRFPNHPRCVVVVRPPPFTFCQRFPRHPRCRVVLPGRPIVVPGRPRPPVVRPLPGRPPIVRPFPGRPPVVRPFPGRPPVARPFPGRPPVARPPVVRQNVQRGPVVRQNRGRPFERR
jgi:hypothetical protein